jgi:hypothetical protein
VITNKNGSTTIYYVDRNNTNPTAKVYYGPNGGTARMITDNNGKKIVEITTANGSKIVYTGDNTYTYNSQDNTINQYSPDTISNGSDYNTAYSSSTYIGPNGGQATTISGPNGNTYSTYDSSAYMNSLPPGIPRSQIPSGQEDLYILKTQVVPPVCPAPVVRCPEPKCEQNNAPPYLGAISFAGLTSAITNSNAPPPVPVLNDFSTFGM